jgi:hypothetical protein
MKLGIMQPYFFPYIGYFQLINAVDKYVIYDDVNFIKGGWINRNRILMNGAPFMINLPLEGASSFKKINEISVGKKKEILLKTIEQSYSKAPYVKEIMQILSDIIYFDENNLALFLANSIITISEYIGINTEFILSSSLKKDNNLKGQEKVISICKEFGATEYYNAIGGQELYNAEDFAKDNIALIFLKTHNIIYNQRKSVFFPNLSIVDMLMWNSKEEINEMLYDFEII